MAKRTDNTHAGSNNHPPDKSDRVEFSSVALFCIASLLGLVAGLAGGLVVLLLGPVFLPMDRAGLSGAGASSSCLASRDEPVGSAVAAGAEPPPAEAASSGQSTTSTSFVPLVPGVTSPGLARIFGSQTRAAEFLSATYWVPYPSRHWRHFPVAAEHIGSTFEAMFSLPLAQHLLSHNDVDSRQNSERVHFRFAYERDVKYVVDGETFNEAWLPGKPSTFRHMLEALEGQATAVLNKAESLCPQLYDLCAKLELEVDAWVDANVYITPKGAAGFAPHYDSHDTMILQSEGVKLWSVCEKKPYDHIRDRRKYSWEKDPSWKSPKNFFKDSDFANCSDVLMRPGDVLYLPEGTVHSARSSEGSYSTHITLGLSLWEFSFATLLADLGGEARSEALQVKLSTLAKSHPVLRTPLPRMDELQRAVSLQDLPDGFLEEWKKSAKKIASSDKDVMKVVRPFLDSTSGWTNALSTFLQRVQLGSLLPLLSCIPQKPQKKGSYRRVFGSRVAVLEIEDAQAGVAVKGDAKMVSSKWVDGIQFALGSFAISTTRGRPFTLLELKKAMKSPQEAGKLLHWMLRHCVIEEVNFV